MRTNHVAGIELQLRKVRLTHRARVLIFVLLQSCTQYVRSGSKIKRENDERNVNKNLSESVTEEDSLINTAQGSNNDIVEYSVEISDREAE